jgi:hypothetical protein
MTAHVPVSDTARALRVIETNPALDPRWEPFVAAHPEGSIYHHPGWLGAIGAEYGQPSAHLACEDHDGRLLGVLPLFYTRGLPFNIGRQATGRRLCSLPRTPLGGPLSTSPEATRALIQSAVDLCRRRPGVQLQLKTHSPDLETLAGGITPTPWRFSYVLPLPERPEDLRFGNAAARHKIKWAVNKAAKLGVQVRAAGREPELRAWYALYLEAMRRNSVPPRSYRFFHALWTHLHPKGLMRLLLAERVAGGQRSLLAGSVFLMFGRSVCYAFTGSTREDLSFHPNDIIQWRAIHDACRSGFQWYDFGEVPADHATLARFKTKWGAEAVPLYRYYYPAPQTSPAPHARPDSSVWGPLSAVWKRLPLRLTAVLGDLLYSRL